MIARRLNRRATLNKNTKIYVAGHRGMVGSALVRALERAGHTNLIVSTRSELDLLRQQEVEDFFQSARPEVVVLAAARVGGIHANATAPADFGYENLMIASNVIHSAHLGGVSCLLNLGSSCIYPRMAEQPIRESALLSSDLEPSNEAYALAKIAGLKLCQYYRQQYGDHFFSAMPCNLYGPGDRYHPENAHVIPALIRRIEEARIRGDSSVELWGSGTPLREFLHVDDLASACLCLLNTGEPPDWVNVGSGSEISIGELAEMIAEVVGFDGNFVHDRSKPDGTPRKLLDSGLIRELGWEPGISLKQGLQEALRDFRDRRDSGELG